MRTLPFRAELILLLWMVASGDAADFVPSTSFSLGIPFEIDAALNPYLHLPALEMASGCNHKSSMSKRHEFTTERLYDTIAMVWTTTVSTTGSEGKDKVEDATAKDSDRRSQDAPNASQKKVYLGGNQPDGCPEDIDTLHCDECGGNKGSLDGMSRCKGPSILSVGGNIADHDMQWEDCICVDIEFSHSDRSIRRRGERMTSPYTLETLRLIEEYGSEVEDEPVNMKNEIANAEDTAQSALQAETEASNRVSPTAR